VTNPFYVLTILLFVAACFLGRNNKYAAFACFLVGVLSAFVGTYHNAP